MILTDYKEYAEWILYDSNTAMECVHIRPCMLEPESEEEADNEEEPGVWNLLFTSLPQRRLIYTNFESGGLVLFGLHSRLDNTYISSPCIYTCVLTIKLNLI